MTIRVVNVRGLKTPEQRSGVCYCGRGFAGWPRSKWGNPYRPTARLGGPKERDIADCLERFRTFAQSRSAEWLADLWEACEQGTKPLGCWCTTATHGDGQPIVCHAQLLAGMLHERFMEGVTGGL